MRYLTNVSEHNVNGKPYQTNRGVNSFLYQAWKMRKKMRKVILSWLCKCSFWPTSIFSLPCQKKLLVWNFGMRGLCFHNLHCKRKTFLILYYTLCKEKVISMDATPLKKGRFRPLPSCNGRLESRLFICYSNIFKCMRWQILTSLFNDIRWCKSLDLLVCFVKMIILDKPGFHFEAEAGEI